MWSSSEACGLTSSTKISLDLLQITLHDEMLDVCPSDHKPLTLAKVDATKLCLNDPAIPDNLHQNVQVFGRIRDPCHDVQLVRKIRPKIHHLRVVFLQEIDFERGELATYVRRREKVGEGSANGPIHVFQPLDPMVVIGQEAPFVSQNSGLIDEESRCLPGKRLLPACQHGLDESLELALLADDLPDKRIVVLEKSV